MREKAPNIVYHHNKKSGTIYAYEDRPYWDPEKKQSRSKRKLLGKVDPSSGKIVPTRKRKPMEPAATETLEPSMDAGNIIKKVLVFLKLCMCETLAKRVLSIVLIAMGVANSRISELTGLCDSSLRKLRKEIADGKLDALFHVGGGGRKGKLTGVEAAIIDEIKNNEYHSHQQIADMVHEKHGIKVSLPVIRRLLKKTASGA